MNSPPQRPVAPESSPRRSATTIVLAALGGFLLFGLFVLAMIPLGAFGVFVAAVAVVFALVGGLQYLLWGWWLGPMLRAKVRADGEDSPTEE
jgi:dolichol kinase